MQIYTCLNRNCLTDVQTISPTQLTCAGAHEAQDRAQAPLQTKLLAYSSHAEAAKEWFYHPDAAVSPSGADQGEHQPRSSGAYTAVHRTAIG